VAAEEWGDGDRAGKRSELKKGKVVWSLGQ
jgi:hypothetical protein